MRKVITGIMVVLVAMVVVLGSTVLAAPDIADSAFKRVWDRQDYLIDQGESIGRSWTWGPTVSGALQEPLTEGVNGVRKVQYFEKSRMEINDPNADPSSMWYVTNGLLPVELMHGRFQTGYDFNTDYETHKTANIAVIGDPGDNFPTYADLKDLYRDPTENPLTVSGENMGQPVTKMLQADGSIKTFDDYADNPIYSGPTTLIDAEFEGAPQTFPVVKAFYDFMKQTGFVYENGQTNQGQVFNPTFVFGYPVTEPYWVNATVGGQQIPILFQVFERRVLTYNPANDPDFQVEMGNVGSHYYQWRYGDDPSSETPAPTEEPGEEPTTEPTTEPYPEP